MRILATTLTILYLLCGVGQHKPVEIPNDHAIYPRGFIIAEMEKETDTLILDDGTGLEWKYEGIEDYWVGDYVVAIMDDNGTPNSIYDDIILDLRYGGYYE